MRSVFAICAIISAAAVAAAQQTTVHFQLPSPERVTLANGTAGLAAAALRPLVITPPPDPVCEGAQSSGTARLSLVIDAQGRARNIIAEGPVGNELDYLAVRLAGNDVFKPAMLNGAAVAVAATLELKMEGCASLSASSKGNENLSVHLRAMPEAKLNIPRHAPPTASLIPFGTTTAQLIAGADMSGLTAPVPVLTPSAYPRPASARTSNHPQEVCIFSFLIDEYGLPENFHVVRSIDPSPMKRASEAVHKYRFRPATKDGMPVATYLSLKMPITPLI